MAVISSALAELKSKSGTIFGISLKNRYRPESIKDTLSFCLTTGADKKDLAFSYSDFYFEKDATEYNHELARMSIRVALSAFNSSEYGTNGADDYSEKSKNITDLLEKCHFTNIEVNEDYKVVPTTNSIGVCVGKKKLGKNMLVVVAIRGGGYEAEWVGNFNCFTDINVHPGFQCAAEKVECFVEEYLLAQFGTDKKSVLEKGNVKLWITGYSRGGAVANLVAKYFDEHKKILKENIYAYTFEAPQPTAEVVEQSMYNNIFNIINPADFVPKVVMSDWGYHRLGTDILIPYGDDVNYIQYNEKVLKLFREYSEDETGTLPDAEAQAKVLTSISSALAKWMKSSDSERTKSVSEKIQKHFISKDYSTPPSKKSDSGTDILSGVISTICRVTGNAEITKQIKNIESFSRSLKKAHYHELTLAWLDACTLSAN